MTKILRSLLRASIFYTFRRGVNVAQHCVELFGAHGFGSEVMLCPGKFMNL